MVPIKRLAYYVFAASGFLHHMQAQHMQSSMASGVSMKITGHETNLAIQIRFVVDEPVTLNRKIDKTKSHIDLCLSSIKSERLNPDAVNQDLSAIVNRFPHIFENAYVVQGRDSAVIRFECIPEKPFVIALRQHAKQHKIDLDLFPQSVFNHLTNDQPIIRQASASDHALDQPVLQVSHQKNTRIVIDAGHGGGDPGACGCNGVQEKDITLAIARRVHTTLRKQGYHSLLTRSSDTGLSLDARVDLCKALKGDLFISIHANAPGLDNPVAAGVETYHALIEQNNLGGGTTEYIGLHVEQESRVIATIKQAITRKIDQSKQLAHTVHSALFASLRSNGHHTIDRGVKRNNFFVLTASGIPAILIETGFVTNPAESKALQTARYQQTLATGICNGIIQYVKNEWTSAKNSFSKLIV